MILNPDLRGPHRLGDLALSQLAADEPLKGETVTGVASPGRAAYYEVSGPSGLRLTVRDARWQNGERDVVACERHSSPERFDTLVERLRLAVLDYGGPYVELRQARLRPNGRAGLFDADLAALAEGAGIYPAAALRTHGATAVGTRAELLGDTGRTRRRFGVRFPADAELVPAVAYNLTRVSPVLRDIRA